MPLAAQQAAQGGGDPRVGLAAGYEDAGEAAWHMEQVANVPRPQGFYEPATPAGEPVPGVSNDDEKSDEKKAAEEKDDSEESANKPAPKPFTGLNFANTDLAFAGNHLFIGNFNGFNVYDVSTPSKPELVTSVVCPGGQGDVSVHGSLLFMSVEQTRGRIDCGTGGVEDPVSRERFRGVRIFDISDVRMPRQVAAVQTCRGSHTHTLVTRPDDPSRVYVYGSGTSVVRSSEELEGCSDGDPDENPDTADCRLSVPPTTTHQAPRPPRPQTSPTTSRGTRRWGSRQAPARATASCSTSATRSRRSASTTSRTRTSPTGTRPRSTTAGRR